MFVWTYRIEVGDWSDRDLLQSLVEDETFAYSYVAPYPSPEVDGVRVHGPARIEGISAADFRRSTSLEATEGIRKFLSSGAAPHALEELKLAKSLSLPLNTDLTVYELQPYEGGFHSLGWLLGDYRDWVLIDRAGETLKEVVVGFD